MKRGEKRENPAASQQAVAKAQIEKHSNGKTLFATSNVLYQQAVLNAKDTITVQLNSQGHIL